MPIVRTASGPRTAHQLSVQLGRRGSRRLLHQWHAGRGTAAGYIPSNIIFVQCVLADIADYGQLNDWWREQFPDPSSAPARFTFQAGALPFGDGPHGRRRPKTAPPRPTHRRREIEEAEYAVLDATLARLDADEAAQATIG